MSVHTYKNGLAVGLAINKMPVSIDFYNTGGVFSPFFGSQLTINQTMIEVDTENSNFKKIQLKFISIPITNKQLPTGKFIIRYLTGDTWIEEDFLTDIHLNHARNFSSWRRDLVHWKHEVVASDTKFSVWYYNFYNTKTFTGIGKILDINLNNTNCIHYIL